LHLLDFFEKRGRRGWGVDGVSRVEEPTAFRQTLGPGQGSLAGDNVEVVVIPIDGMAADGDRLKREMIVELKILRH
jgi:hypothetical protein